MTTLQRAFSAMTPTQNSAAIWRLVLASLIALGGFLVAAEEPAGWWGWVKFCGGLLTTLLVPIERTWAPYPGAGLEQRGK
jgi:hypothetical protein